MKQLKTLKLEDSYGVTDASLPVFATRRLLEQLQISGPNFAPEAVRILRRKLPHCAIEVEMCKQPNLAEVALVLAD